MKYGLSCWHKGLGSGVQSITGRSFLQRLILGQILLVIFINILGAGSLSKFEDCINLEKVIHTLGSAATIQKGLSRLE